MSKKTMLLGVATLLSASVALTACGSRTETSASAGGSAATKTVKIGVIAPLTGDLAPLGLGIRNSVDLAIQEANKANAIPGWKLELAAEDDTATPDVGANAATKLAADASVVGVVGTLNSGVSQSVQPILASANITQVSPANTGDYLTLGADIASPKRTYATYFRTCTRDGIQGPFAAQYLFESGIKKLAVVNDKKPYGQGLANQVVKKFTELGGEVVANETVNKDDKDFTNVISLVKGKSPEAVYVGSEYQLVGPFSQQLHAAGVKVPVMGGDGIYDPKYIELAGAESNGDLATSVGAPTESLASAKAYVDAYNAAGFKEPYAAYGAYAYDAANSIINALKTTLPNAASVEAARQPTVAAMASVSFDGATGKVAFDQYGDAVSKVLTVYEVKDGKWAAKKTGEFK